MESGRFGNQNQETNVIFAATGKLKEFLSRELHDLIYAFWGGGSVAGIQTQDLVHAKHASTTELYSQPPVI